MTDLVVWLRQQLDTDEQLALAAAEVREGARDWRFRVAMDLHTGPEYELHMGGRVIHAGMPGDEDEPLRRAEIQHMAANDPDRALRQVQAHRAILDLHERIPGDGINFTLAEQDRAEEVLKALASIYSDRDGYRTEWSA